MTAIRVEVLGPLRLFVDGRPVDVRGPKRRAVLALLAVAQGRALTVDHLLDALWPAELPDSARGALHSHVFRLRGQLGPAGARLETLDSAYRLAAELDLDRARSLHAAARGAIPAAAYPLLNEAHGLWRGPVLAEFGEVAPLVVAAAGIEQLRTEVTDALIGAAVDAGRAPEVLGLAADAVAADPLREPAVLLRMRVLAASGQAAAALAGGREYRHRLAEETGLDPSPALGELERAVAAGAAASPPAADRPRPRATPRPVTPLVGRDAQVAAVHRLLDAERLVTVLGPGGVGKTRLALEVVARRDPAGVLLLAPVTAVDAIPHALASALNLHGVRGDVLTACVAHLAARPGLLLVDNCEHLLDGARDAVAALLDGCPQLTVLATSRVPLGLPGECASRLAPLPLPAPGTDAGLDRVPSVAVFLDRAARVRPGFAPDAAELQLVAGIVRRLDGIPLAIELAAGRLSTFSPAELADRLQRCLDLLGGARSAADARHRTLRATVDWSYRLLPEPEQRLFRHLAVFPDGVDLATAEAVAANLDTDRDPGSALAHLVDASMVDAEAGAAGTRYRMLETLRGFALDRLAAAGEQEAAEERLLGWARDLTGWIDATVVGPDEPRADAVLRRELPNLRAAWRLARDRGDLDTAAAMVAGLYEAVVWRDVIEIRGWAEELAAQPGSPAHPVVAAAAARAAYMRGDSDAAERRARACLNLGGDAAVWHGSNALALVHLARGEFGQVIERELDAAALATHADGGLGVAALAATYAGDLPRARELNGRLTAGAASTTMQAFTAYVAGEIDSAAGDPVAAQKHYARAVELARASGATFVVGIASVGRLTVLAETGQHADALYGYRDVIDYFARTGNWSHLWTTMRNLVRLLRRLGDEPTADLLDAAADHAPDAPPLPHRESAPGKPTLGREEALRTARAAIDGHLAAGQA